jgi:hypothetical protein
MSYLNVNQISTAAGAPSFTTAAGGININGNVLGAGNASTMKNRIINGAMVIDQRNAGASVTATTSFPFSVDRWQLIATQNSKYTAQQNAGSVTPPAGFSNYIGITSSSAYSITSTDQFRIIQNIEGFNTADLGFGTANAKTVTLSFWVRSSLTGTFGGALTNDVYSRSYPFSYTISSANTWEQKSITVAGDTTGTWVGATNGSGMVVNLSFGIGSTLSSTAGAWAAGTYVSATGATSVVGTSGATFYITGVQLEVGSSATGYEYRQYTTELQLAQRYYNKYFFTSGSGPTGFNDSSTKALIFYNYLVTMRGTPTVETTGTASDYQIRYTGNTANLNAVPSLESATNQQIRLACTVASGLTAGQGVALIGSSTSIYVAFNSEL